MRERRINREMKEMRGKEVNEGYIDVREGTVIKQIKEKGDRGKETEGDEENERKRGKFTIRGKGEIWRRSK